MSQCQKVSGMTVHHRLHRNEWNCLITMVHPNRTQHRPVPLSQLQLSSENTSSCVTAVVVTSCHVWSSGLSTLTPCHGYTKSRWRRCLCRLPVHQWNGSLAVEGCSCAPHRARLSNRMLSDLVFLKCNNDQLPWTVLLNTGTEGLLSLNQKPIKPCNI